MPPAKENAGGIFYSTAIFALKLDSSNFYQSLSQAIHLSACSNPKYS